MRNKKFESILKAAVPELPGFVMKGRLFFVAPIKDAIHGISFDPSAFGSVSFYMTVFVMPLCPPCNFVHYTFGKRIEPRAKGAGWKTDLPNVVEALVDSIRMDAIPFLTDRASLSNLVKITPPSNNVRTQEALAYCLARIGRVNEAIAAFDHLLRTMTYNVPWEHDLAAQARVSRAKLVDDPADAQRQLAAWEAETVQSLGLAEFRRSA